MDLPASYPLASAACQLRTLRVVDRDEIGSAILSRSTGSMSPAFFRPRAVPHELSGAFGLTPNARRPFNSFSKRELSSVQVLNRLDAKSSWRAANSCNRMKINMLQGSPVAQR